MLFRSLISVQRRNVRAMSTKYPSRGNRFEGKNIIVTGAAGNFGGVCAKMLAAEGANIALVDLDVDKLPAVKKEVESYGVKVSSFGVDLTDDSKVKNMVSEVKAEFGSIEGLFNNAGYQVTNSLSLPSHVLHGRYPHHALCEM